MEADCIDGLILDNRVSVRGIHAKVQLERG